MRVLTKYSKHKGRDTMTSATSKELCAKDGSKVIAAEAPKGCNGCIFDKHQSCANFAGSRLIDICIDGYIFKSSNEAAQ